MAETTTSTKVPVGPAALYKHDHPPVKNAHETAQAQLSRGQKVADKVASTVGGWPFIIIQSIMLVIWMALNVYLVRHIKDAAFDPYPFILLNLVLSFQAAYTGPIVMMSQNRQNEKDRYAAQCDFECNLRAEEEIRVLMEHLAHQDLIMADIISHLAAVEARLAPEAATITVGDAS